MRKAFKTFLPILFLLSACEEFGFGQAPPPPPPPPPPPRAAPSGPAVVMYDRMVPRTLGAAERFNLSIQHRCAVDWSDQVLISSQPYNPRDFLFSREDKGDPLPNIHVENLSANNETINTVIRNLLRNTGIRLYYTETFQQTLNFDGISGDLNRVLDIVTAMGNIYYSYDNRARKLTLRRWARWGLQVPSATDLILATEDALRGIDLDDLVIDWGDNLITFSGDIVTEQAARNTISRLMIEDVFVAFDMDVYRVEPFGDEINWMDMLSAFNQGSIRLSQQGIIGRGLVVGDNVSRSSLNNFLAPRGRVTLISSGTFITPERWQGRFDIGRCSRDPYIETVLSVLTQTRFDTREEGIGRLDNTIVLRTGRQDIASYRLPSRLGENLLIIGIPTQYFAEGRRTDVSPRSELVVFISPRIIRIERPSEY